MNDLVSKVKAPPRRGTPNAGATNDAPWKSRSVLECADLSALSLRLKHSRVAGSSRSSLAELRLPAARAALANCHLCEHRCEVNRLAGELGLCHAGADARIFSAQLESGDELELIPTFAIALSGCDLRCDFCITGAESWNPRTGEALDLPTLAGRAEAALADGARTIMILGGEPTIHLPTVLAIVAALPDSAGLVWKTNAHGSAQARELLDGMFDVWVADYKFGDDACAARLAKVPDYLRVVRENLRWANERSELIVRHLLMPGHIECCWRPIAEWLAAELPRVKTNLRSSFWPAWHSARHQELRRTVSRVESDRAWEMAREYGLNLVE
jgi:putative pyruvate formate lyase activating enzyme